MVLIVAQKTIPDPLDRFIIRVLNTYHTEIVAYIFAFLSLFLSSTTINVLPVVSTKLKENRKKQCQMNDSSSSNNVRMSCAVSFPV